MKKLIVLLLLIIFTFCSIANAGTRLRGKGIYNVHNKIAFVTADPVEQIFDNKIKVTMQRPITGISFSGEIGIKPAEPTCNVYYFRVSGIGHADNVFGVKGLAMQLENLTDNVLVIHWKDSVIQIGNNGGMPFINGMKYIDAGKPSETPNTVLPPKASLNIEIYPATKVKYYSSWGWHILVEPISSDGSTQATVTMKIEENGASKYYSFKSPQMDFPTAFLAEYKYDKQK